MPRRRGADQRNLVIASIISPSAKIVRSSCPNAASRRASAHNVASAPQRAAMKSKKRLVISLAVVALALGGLWF
jgi:hypothetical protein